MGNHKWEWQDSLAGTKEDFIGSWHLSGTKTWKDTWHQKESSVSGQIRRCSVRLEQRTAGRKCAAQSAAQGHGSLDICWKSEWIGLEETLMPRKCIWVLSFGHRRTSRGPQAGWIGDERKNTSSKQWIQEKIEEAVFERQFWDGSHTTQMWGGEEEEAEVTVPGGCAILAAMPGSTARNTEDIHVVGNTMSAVECSSGSGFTTDQF